MNEIFECLKKETVNKLKKSETLRLVGTVSILISPFEVGVCMALDGKNLGNIEEFAGIEQNQIQNIINKHLNAMSSEISELIEQHMTEKIKKIAAIELDEEKLKKVLDSLFN